VAYRFDDPALNKPPLVNLTPEDMWAARYFVAAACKMPPEIVTDFHVWLYRWGEDPRDIDISPEMVDAMNKHLGRVEMGNEWGDEGEGTQVEEGREERGHKAEDL
jgi:hypothetical protein